MLQRLVRPVARARPSIDMQYTGHAYGQAATHVRYTGKWRRCGQVATLWASRNTRRWQVARCESSQKGGSESKPNANPEAKATRPRHIASNSEQGGELGELGTVRDAVPVVGLLLFEWRMQLRNASDEPDQYTQLCIDYGLWQLTPRAHSSHCPLWDQTCVRCDICALMVLFSLCKGAG